MADVQEAVRRLTIQTTAPGADEAAKSLGNVSKAMEGVTVASTSTEKATLSLDQKFASLERRYVSGVSAQAQYEKTQRLVNAAVAQNPALQDRANAILAAAKDRHDQLTNSQKALSVVTGDLNGRIQASAGSFGVVGNALTALGPLGLTVAAGIGTLIAGFNLASDAAHNLAEKAKELREFAEATGLTTTQVQALKAEAGKFGIDSETLSGGLQKFTAGFQQLRLGTGDLLTQIRRINPALAEQIQGAQDAATAFTLFGQAVAQTDNIFQRNALLKAGLGKGSAIFGSFFETAPDVSALTNAFAAAGKGLDDNLIKKLAQLQVEIDKTRGAASTIVSSIFAVNVLTAEKQYADVLLDIAKTFKLISETKFPDVPDWIKNSASFAGRAALNLTPLGGVAALAGAARSAFSAGASAYDAKNQPFAQGGDPLAASSYGGGAGPASITSTLTIDAQAEKLKNLVAILGSAATPAQRFAASVAELGIKARDAGVSQDVLAKGIEGLKLDDAIARQSQHNSALGAAASVTDIMTAKTLELNKAQQQGAGLTKEQIANIKAVTAAQALGTYNIQTQIDAENLRIQTLFMGTEAATAYATAQTVINKAIQDGKPLTAEQIADLRATSAEYARVKTQADSYGDALNTVASTMSGTLVTGLSDVLDGTKSVGQGFADMSKAILRSLEEAAIKIAVVTPLIEAFKQAAGGFFGFGGGGTVANGGIVLGNANGPGVFAAANGGTFGPGWGVVGERGPELINVHSRGVTVVPNHVSRPFLPGFADGGMLSAGGNVTRLPFGQDNTAVTVNVHNAPEGTTATAKANRDSNGGLNIEVMLDAANAKNLANPGSATRQVLSNVGRVASR